MASNYSDLLTGVPTPFFKKVGNSYKAENDRMINANSSHFELTEKGNVVMYPSAVNGTKIIDFCDIFTIPYIDDASSADYKASYILNFNSADDKYKKPATLNYVRNDYVNDPNTKGRITSLYSARINKRKHFERAEADINIGAGTVGGETTFYSKELVSKLDTLVVSVSGTAQTITTDYTVSQDKVTGLTKIVFEAGSVPADAAPVTISYTTDRLAVIEAIAMSTSDTGFSFAVKLACQRFISRFATNDMVTPDGY